MTQEKLSRAQVFHALIRKRLLTDWDPIGVGDSPEAQDEYDGYIPQIYRMLIQQKTRAELFDFLWWAETVHMTLAGNRMATERLVDRLMLIPREVDEVMAAAGQQDDT